MQTLHSYRYVSLTCRLMLCALLCTIPIRAQLVINEIMAAPQSPEPEWIELFNTSDDSLVVSNLYLYDATSRAPIPSFSVVGKGYAILCKDTAALLGSRRLPAAARLVRISLPSLNNTGEVLRLQTKDSVTMDSVVYNSAWGKAGCSLERISSSAPMLSAMNCTSCIHSLKATCGFANSVSPMDGDAALIAVYVDTSRRHLVLQVRNMGSVDVRDVVVQVAFKDSAIVYDRIDFLPALGTYSMNVALDSLATLTRCFGYIGLKTFVFTDADTRNDNDTVRLTVFASPPRGSIRINEIHYDPLMTSSFPVGEFVELINADDASHDINGMELCVGDQRCMLSTDTLPPGEVIAVAYDTSTRTYCVSQSRRCQLVNTRFSLRSSGDSIVIRDPYGFVIDSVVYSPSWHAAQAGVTKGKSLERRAVTLNSTKATTWTTSTHVDGCTPGLRNSVSVTTGIRGAQAIPNPFSPRNVMGSLQSCLLQFEAPYVQSLWTIRVFDMAGYEVETLVNGVFGGSIGTAVWTGRMPGGDALQAGPYLIVAEAVDIASSAVHRQSIVAVIAE